jgi:hypothetical protein
MIVSLEGMLIEQMVGAVCGWMLTVSRLAVGGARRADGGLGA